MATRMQQRRGTAAQWISTNGGDGPILEAGEIGFETDTGKFKIGDGVNHWVDLDYFIDESNIDSITDDYVLSNALAQANGVATLDANAKLTSSQLPDIALVTVHSVANSAARLSLSVQPGDIAIQYDNGQTYVLQAAPASTEGNWQPITVADVFPTKNTDNLAEGLTNLYFTNERAQDAANTAITAGTGITKSYDDNANTITIAANNVPNSSLANSSVTINGFEIALGGSATYSSDNIGEGTTNLYFSNARAQSALAGLYDAAGTAANAVADHANDITSVHGITGNVVGTTDSQSLTNKSINLANNTVTGTVAEFNTALSDGDFATLSGAETISNKVSITSNALVAQYSFTLNSNDLYVGSQSNVLRIADGYTNPMAVFSIDADDDYAQLVVKNTGNGTNSSSDIIAYANNGDDNAGWTNIGFTANTFADPAFTITGPNDGYLFVEGALGNVQEVINKEVANNVVTLTTTFDHGFTAGNEVVIKNVGGGLDGIYTIAATPTTTTFTYNKTTENVASTPVFDPHGEAKVATGDGNLVLATGGNGARNKIVFAAGGLSSDNTQMEIVPDETVHIEIATQSTSSTSGALTVTGGVGISGNLYMAGDLDVDGDVDFSGVQHLPIGTNAFAFSETLTNPVITAVANKDDYQQIAFKNESSNVNASTDFIAYANNGTDDAGYIDMGITSSTFADPAFTITGENDGYIFMVAPANTVGNGDLVLATGNTGARNAIVFAAGGLASDNTQVTIVPDQNVHIEIPTPSTSPTTGALTVVGGVGIQGDLNIEGNVDIEGTIVFGGENTTVETSNLAVTDPMIYVANANAADTVDIAFVGEYKSNSVTKYTGIARDASDGVFKLFNNANTKPTSTVNFAEVGLGYADLRVGGLTANNATIGSVTNTEIGYLSGVSSAIQTQLNNKLDSSTASSTYAPINNPIFTGTVSLPSSIEFEGSTANDNETILTVTDPTQDRTITLPDATGTVSLVTGTETLQNKTVNLSNNTLTGTIAQFNTALSDADFATLAGTETLTGKTVNLANNTVSGTIAQFNTALSDADFATLAGTETLTNKTANNLVLNGTLTAGGGAGTSGQYLKTTGTGITWDSVPVTSTATANTVGTVYGFTNANGADSVTVLGYEALLAGTQVVGGFIDSSQSIAIGWRAANASQYADYTIAIGNSALRFGTEPSFVIAIGDSAMYSGAGGGDSTAVGHFTLTQLTTGARNMAFGAEALSRVTSGNDNIGVGYNTTAYVTTNSFNTGVGGAALGGNGSNNTALGYSSLRSITTGSNNTAVGTNTGYSANNLTTGSNNIIIGYNAASSSATVSNEITLGDNNVNAFRIPGMEIDWHYGLMEKVTTSATAATGTINYDLITNKSVLYYTTNSSGNWTLNVRGNSTTTLNSLMSVGQSLTVVFMATNGTTAYYQTGFQVDGVAVTPRWQGGTAPTSGNASSIDAYSVTIIKTAESTFTVLESQTRFA